MPLIRTVAGKRSLWGRPLARKYSCDGCHGDCLLPQELPQVTVRALNSSDHQLGGGPVLPPLLLPVLPFLLPGPVKGLQVLPVQPSHGIQQHRGGPRSRFDKLHTGLQALLPVPHPPVPHPLCIGEGPPELLDRACKGKRRQEVTGNGQKKKNTGFLFLTAVTDFPPWDVRTSHNTTLPRFF